LVERSCDVAALRILNPLRPKMKAVFMPDPANPATAPAIEISGLKKTYAKSRKADAKTALKGVDLVVPRGSIFGLLGPNGAGKSTLINILAGLVRKTEGSARICGFDIDTQTRQARSSIGIVPQEIAMDVFFTPLQALNIQAGYYGVPKSERRSEEILQALGLWEKRDAYVRQLSGGSCAGSFGITSTRSMPKAQRSS